MLLRDGAIISVSFKEVNRKDKHENELTCLPPMAVHVTLTFYIGNK